MNEHQHEMIIVCTHVIEENVPLGTMDEDIKDSTLLCQKCVDVICENPDGMKSEDIPKEIHFACKECVVDKLHNSRGQTK